MSSEDSLKYFIRKSGGKEVKIRMRGEKKPLTIYCKIDDCYKICQEDKRDQILGLLITPARIDFEDDFYTEILRNKRQMYVRVANISTLATK